MRDIVLGTIIWAFAFVGVVYSISWIPFLMNHVSIQVY